MSDADIAGKYNLLSTRRFVAKACGDGGCHRAAFHTNPNKPHPLEAHATRRTLDPELALFAVIPEGLFAVEALDCVEACQGGRCCRNLDNKKETQGLKALWLLCS